MVNNIKLTPDLLKNWTSVWKNLSSNTEKHYLLKRLSDASTKSQLQSKLWLINELKNIKLNNKDIQTNTVASQTINVNFSYSANSAVILYRIRPDTSKQLIVKQRRNNTSTTTSFTTGSAVFQQTDIAIGGCAVADNTYFTDTGTTGGSWSAVFYQEQISGTDIAVFGQTKIMNAQGSLPYNGFFVSSGIESAAGYLLVVTEQGKPYWGMLTL